MDCPSGSPSLLTSCDNVHEAITRLNTSSWSVFFSGEFSQNEGPFMSTRDVLTGMLYLAVFQFIFFYFAFTKLPVAHDPAKLMKALFSFFLFNLSAIVVNTLFRYIQTTATATLCMLNAFGIYASVVILLYFNREEYNLRPNRQATIGWARSAVLIVYFVTVAFLYFFGTPEVYVSGVDCAPFKVRANAEIVLWITVFNIGCLCWSSLEIFKCYGSTVFYVHREGKVVGSFVGNFFKSKEWKLKISTSPDEEKKHLQIV